MKQRRVLALWLVSTGLLVALPDWLPSPPSGGWASWKTWLLTDPQRGLVLAAGCLAFLIAAWLFLLTGLTLTAGALDPSGRAARRAIEWLTPRFARGLMRTLLGAAIVVGPATPAFAAGSPGAPLPRPVASLAPVPAPIVAPPELPPLLVLDRPGETPRQPMPPSPRPSASPTTTTPPTAQASTASTHLVQRGDTLWGLAAAQLPSGSSAADITRGWQQWYAANREEIGPDPGLILIGERLVIPRETP